MLQKLMKRTAVLVCLFSMMTLGLIIGLSTTKLVTITEVAQDEVVGTGNTIVPQASSADSENALALIRRQQRIISVFRCRRGVRQKRSR